MEIDNNIEKLLTDYFFIKKYSRFTIKTPIFY